MSGPGLTMAVLNQRTVDAVLDLNDQRVRDSMDTEVFGVALSAVLALYRRLRIELNRQAAEAGAGEAREVR